MLEPHIGNRVHRDKRYVSAVNKTQKWASRTKHVCARATLLPSPWRQARKENLGGWGMGGRGMGWWCGCECGRCACDCGHGCRWVGRPGTTGGRPGGDRGQPGDDRGQPGGRPGGCPRSSPGHPRLSPSRPPVVPRLSPGRPPVDPRSSPGSSPRSSSGRPPVVPEPSFAPAHCWSKHSLSARARTRGLCAIYLCIPTSFSCKGVS